MLKGSCCPKDGGWGWSTSGVSGNVITGSPVPSPPPPVSSISTKSSTDFLRALKWAEDELEEDMFFISDMLDLSSVRSDFMEEAFISLLEVIWWTLWDEEDVDEDEQDVLATREELLLLDSIWDMRKVWRQSMIGIAVVTHLMSVVMR